MLEGNLRLADGRARKQPWIPAAIILTLACWTVPGCGVAPPPSDPCEVNPLGCPATFVGSATCLTCHETFSRWHSLHGHSQALKGVSGGPPRYPDPLSPAGVPTPPLGLAWSEIRWVIGGYNKAANFVGNGGFLFTDGPGGPLTQYNLPFLISLAPGGHVPTSVEPVETLSYDYACFRCHTTGPLAMAENGGRRQENRPGVGGTWALDGVQCEACHGPGSIHIRNPAAGNLELPGSAAFCGRCHGDPGNPGHLPAADGFLLGHYQWAETLASPHDDFDCTFCHEPHTSVLHDRDLALRNTCQNCHSGANMARHEAKVFAQGDYAERVTCQSCHMPPAARNASFTLIGQARIGDTRSHLMNIDTMPRTFPSTLTADGTQLPTGADGKAAVTVDVVCLRCHHGGGSAFALNLEAAASIAEGIHDPP